MEPDLKIEFSFNVGELRIPFSITVERASVEKFVEVVTKTAAESVGILDLLRKNR